MTARRNKNKLCMSLVAPPSIHHMKSIHHGIVYEKVARVKFSEVQQCTVKPCGLFISCDYPYLASTPDGLVGDNALLEIKCPYIGRNESIKVGPKFKFLGEIDGVLTLKRSHGYFDQVQGQMYITKRSLCYFVTYTFQDLQIIKVPVDLDYCENSLFPKLNLFYTKTFLPFLGSYICR